MLPEQHDKFMQELFLHATESILVSDESGFIRMINPAAEKLFGYSLGELKGQLIETLIPERFNSHKENRENYYHSPKTRSMGIGLDLYAKRKDGSEFPVEISLSPFFSDNNRFIIAFVVDISARKQLERKSLEQKDELEKLAKELKVTNERLEFKVKNRTKVLQEALSEIERSRNELSEALNKEKELNELKSRFLSMASHEFRTPLTSILSSADLILDYNQQEDAPKRSKHIQRIKSAVNNLNGILGDFLSLSRIEEGKIQVNVREFNVQEFILDICHEMKAIAPADQQFVYYHEGDSQAIVDSTLLRNILINLISNAIKFSLPGKNIFLHSELTNGKLKVSIRDEGIGISKADQVHLFERFFRGSNAINIPGTGLGLNIVSKYVELMNGKIELKSALNEGTEFTLTLPMQNNHFTHHEKNPVN